MGLKAHLCIRKEAERKNRRQRNPNSLVRASGAPAPAPPRALTGEPSAHGWGEAYQIVNRRGSPQITLQITERGYCTQGYRAHYAMPGKSIWHLYFYFPGWGAICSVCMCVWWSVSAKGLRPQVTGVHVPALPATGMTGVCAYCAGEHQARQANE